MDTMNQQKTNTNAANSHGEIEIDLLELGKELQRHWFGLLFATILCGAIGFCISKFLITPQFESTATMYILTKETTLASLADLQVGTQLTSDYQVVVTNRTVLEKTIEELGLGGQLTYETLKEKITSVNPQNTRMLQITAKDADPQTAMNLANTIAKNSADFIADMMEISPPKVIEKGILPTEKASPSNAKNAIIGALIGFLLVAGSITVGLIMKDAVVTEADVSKYLGLSVLSSLPDRSEAKKKTKKDKKSRLRQSRKK